MTETLDGFGLSDTERKKLLQIDEWKITSFVLKYAMEQPDIIGESLRDFSFIGEGLGCYHDFELREGFVRLEEESSMGKVLMQSMNYVEEVEYAPSVHLYHHPKLNLYLSWYWDGDGTLLFGYQDKWVLNTDCKKRYDWEFVQNPFVHS